MPAKLYLGDESKIQMPNAFGDLDLEVLRQAHASVKTSTPVVGEQYREVKLSAIVGESPLQARAPFDADNDEDDGALLDSLASGAQRLPVVLAEVEGSAPPTYTPLDGHRRIAALRRLNQETVKAIIVQQGTLECDLITLTAHIRKNLTPLELARTIDRLRQRHHKTVKEIAQTTGLSRRYIEQLNSLLKTDPTLQAEVEDNHISATTARVLGQAAREHQPHLAQIAATNGLSDAKAKRLVQRIEATDETPEQAALALGFVSQSGGAKANGRISDEVTTTDAQLSNVGPKRGRKPKLILTMESAVALVKNIFPEIDPQTAQALSALAVEQEANPTVLKIAGLRLMAGQEAAEALEVADRAAQNPGVRKILAFLDVCIEIQGLIDKGWLGFVPESELLLDALVSKLGRLKQSIARRGRVPPTNTHKA